MNNNIQNCIHIIEIPYNNLGKLFVILNNHNDLQNFIDLLKFDDTITIVEIRVPLEKLNLSNLLNVKSIFSIYKIDNLYIRGNPICKLGEGSNVFN
jgi:hypothetical protein